MFLKIFLASILFVSSALNADPSETPKTVSAPDCFENFGEGPTNSVGTTPKKRSLL